MALTPFAAGSLTARRTGETFSALRGQLDDVQRQVATAKRADTYSGLGLGRRTSLDSRAKISAAEGYEAAVTNGQLRAKVVRTGLESLSKTVTALKQQGTLATFDPETGGRTALQQSSLNQLKTAVEVLNADVNGRYVFGGRRDDTPPVVDVQTMLEGSGGQIGLREAIRRGKVNDRAADGLGHLSLEPLAGNVAALAEGSGSVLNGFSLRPADPRSGSASISVTSVPAPGAPPGAPGSRRLEFTVGAGLANGEVVTFSLGLKDGTTVPIELRAVAGSGTPEPGTFFIGGSAAASAANLRTALGQAVQAAEGSPRFAAASAVAAADRFFAGAEPGAVQWYRGEGAGSAWLAGEPDAAGADRAYSVAAREGVPQRVDADQSVGLGARANEAGFRNALAGMATVAVESFDTTPAQRSAETSRYQAILERTAVRLDGVMGPGNLKSVLNDFANATANLTDAGERQKATKAIWSEALAGVENANLDEAATALRSLEVRLQASYQMTSILSKLSLVNYL